MIKPNKFKVLILLCCFNFPTLKLAAQLFQVDNSSISNDVSDSRSVNFLDLNNDGWEDIYISNGPQGGQQDLLYLNDGTGQMIPTTNLPIVTVANPSDGASFADYNNDGAIDGVVSSWHGAEDLLYLNDGNGVLNYNAGGGMVAGSYAETAAFGDYDGDGWLDLYITNSGGDKKNFLYRNLQNGQFMRVTEHVLVNDAKLSRGAIWGDFNDDGKTDLFVANESNQQNDLFINIGNGAFEKWMTGSIVLDQKGSMTASWGDIDNNGTFDLFIGNAGFFTGRKNQLFKNLTTEFQEITNDPTVQVNNCTFGSAFGDYDNDGDLDLVLANGFCNTDMTNMLYENQGDGTFVEVSNLLPANADICSFGVAWGDVNNDGALDLMIANCQNSSTTTPKANTLLLNQGNDHNWLILKLVGVNSNTSAIGAKVKIKATIDGVDRWQMREIRSQSGYAGQNSLLAHFGLGEALVIDSMVIDWPAGTSQVLTQVEINQRLMVEESIINQLNEQSEIQQALTFDVFPNPAAYKGSIQIRIKSERNFDKASVLLFNTLGQMMRTEQISIAAGISQFDIQPTDNGLSRGMYQVVLKIGEQKMVRKLTIE